MAGAGREIAKGHAMLAAFSRVQLVHRAKEAKRRNPAGDGICFEERAVDFVGSSFEDSMEIDGAGHGDSPSGES